jgi:hypothetical protein
MVDAICEPQPSLNCSRLLRSPGDSPKLKMPIPRRWHHSIAWSTSAFVGRNWLAAMSLADIQ